MDGQMMAIWIDGRWMDDGRYMNSGKWIDGWKGKFIYLGEQWVGR